MTVESTEERSNTVTGQFENPRCPGCKSKKGPFLFNRQIGCFSCAQCGTMFMEPKFVKGLLAKMEEEKSRILIPGRDFDVKPKRR